jgi:hypothetical protein
MAEKAHGVPKAIIPVFAQTEEIAKSPDVAMEPLMRIQSAREDFEKMFAEFCDGINEQIQAPDQQLNVSAYLRVTETRDQIADLYLFCKNLADMLRQREKALADRRHGLDKYCEMLRSSSQLALEELGVRRLEGEARTYAIRQNPAHVEITDLEKLPAEFMDYVPMANKSAIREALERGETVPGAELVTSTRLDIG